MGTISREIEDIDRTPEKSRWNVISQESHDIRIRENKDEVWEKIMEN